MIRVSIDEDENCKLSTLNDTNTKRIILNYPCTSTTECKPYNIRLLPGIYKFELWGAQGGNGRIWNENNTDTKSGGRGAYISGIAKFTIMTDLFAYIGGKGEDQITIKGHDISKGGYNGGGDGGVDIYDAVYPESAAGGGGGTDIRIIGGDALDFASLKSRIIVAAGGGGAVSDTTAQCNYITTNVKDDLLCSVSDDIQIQDKRGGAGGGLHGYRTASIVVPGNQTKGSFGKGGDGVSFKDPTGGSTGGGGGGYIVL